MNSPVFCKGIVVYNIGSSLFKLLDADCAYQWMRIIPSNDMTVENQYFARWINVIRLDWTLNVATTL